MQEVDNKQVADYYDKFWQELDSKNLGGINSRHRYILYHLKKAGLKKNSTLLEIGCGLGMLTSFIGKELSTGKITGVDISPESVSYANKKYGNKNVSFLVSDMTDFKSNEKFDFIVFPDVLEHIPIEAHSNIFSTVRKLVKDNSIVYVNIPNPIALEYCHEHKLPGIQIIDQPLHAYPFLKPVYENGFYVESIKTYSIFYDEPDYQRMIIKPYLPFKKMTVKSKASVISKSIWLRILNFIN
jgi:2-polyprenyl-3-methyl-5-hydroxy-6-metoxy-1,4-benzoquinol methylase